MAKPWGLGMPMLTMGTCSEVAAGERPLTTLGATGGLPGRLALGWEAPTETEAPEELPPAAGDGCCWAAAVVEVGFAAAGDEVARGAEPAPPRLVGSPSPAPAPRGP